MAIHRQAVSPPVASDEVARIRTELSPQYGAKVHEEGAARVLLIRVPRTEPDPVNDVEDAIEYLQPADVQDITHCLLIGDERVAQVYARPLVDLMQERIAFDRRQAAAWRDRMPGRLGHALYQSPEDPRRRWRLAVRVPVASIKDLDEEMLEDLADGLGPELETPRFQSLVAVYLIAAEDDVRLEPDLFVQELLSTWRDEERRRRLELQLANKEEEERRRKQRERDALLRDMQQRIGQRTVRAPLRRAPLLESETRIRTAPEVRHVRRQVDRLASGPWAQDVPERGSSRGRNGPGGVTWAQDVPERGASLTATVDGDGPSDTSEDRLADPGVGGHSGLRMAVLDDQEDDPSVGGHSRAPMESTKGRSDPDGDGPSDRRLSVDQRADSGERSTASGDETSDRLAPAVAAAERLAKETRARHDDAHRNLDALRSRVDSALDRAGDVHDGTSVQGSSAMTGKQLGRSGPVPPRSERAAPLSTRERQRMDPIDRARLRLEDAGFDVMVRPDTPGHVIDLAGERLEGDPQRIVLRIVERLDPAVARELLKTARELDVDMVLCVAQQVVPDGRRALVATKVKAVSPDELDRFEF